MVAGRREDPERRLEVGERGDLGGVARGGAVDEVAGDHHDVRLLGVDEVDDLAGERRAAHRTGVDVGDESDPQPVELWGQLGRGHLEPGHRRGCRLDRPVGGGAHGDGGDERRATRLSRRRASRPWSCRHRTSQMPTQTSHTVTSPRKR